MGKGWAMAIEHIIFDMDGTLTATARATKIAVDAVRGRYGLPFVSESQIRSAMGLGGLEFHAKLFPGVPEETLAAVGRDIDGLEAANVKKIGRDILFPGVREMLEALAGKGYPLYIASTGSARHVGNTLRSAGIRQIFTGIYNGEPQKIGMVKRIVAGRDPGGFAMVGDMFKDAEAARGNGIVALGAGYGYLDAEDAGLFDAVLDKPGDIFLHLGD
jgi:phosphoglycolate phosphatase-like HAD superfamily hydrolase